MIVHNVIRDRGKGIALTTVEVTGLFTTLFTGDRDQLTSEGTLSVSMAPLAIPATAVLRGGDEVRKMINHTLMAKRGAATQASATSGSAHAGETEKAEEREAPRRGGRGGRKSQACGRGALSSTAASTSP